MPAKSKDTVLLAIGGLVCVGAGVWAFLQQSRIAGFSAAPQIPATGSAYTPSAIKVKSPESQTWAEAQAQSAGDKWIYDVFTPPKIYYNTQTKQFTVVPPTAPKLVDDTPVVPQPPPSFGLDLVRVEQPLFRLQLVGYVGEGAQARGNFLNVKTGSVVFGTTGKKLLDLNLEIVRFSSERRRTKVAGGTEIVEVVTTAVVRDTVTGAEVTLNDKTRAIDGPPIVVLKQSDGTERTAKSGDTFTVGDTTYTVGALTLEPPSATVTRQNATLASPETKTLVIPPPAPANPAPAADGAPAPAPATAPFHGF